MGDTTNMNGVVSRCDSDVGFLISNVEEPHLSPSSSPVVRSDEQHLWARRVPETTSRRF